MMALNSNKDGKLSKDELPESLHGPLLRADSNGNGFASKEELTEMAEAGRHSRAE